MSQNMYIYIYIHVCVNNIYIFRSHSCLHVCVIVISILVPYIPLLSQFWGKVATTLDDGCDSDCPCPSSKLTKIKRPHGQMCLRAGCRLKIAGLILISLVTLVGIFMIDYHIIQLVKRKNWEDLRSNNPSENSGTRSSIQLSSPSHNPAGNAFHADDIPCFSR